MTAALLLNWRTERRMFILTTLGFYVAILAVTAVYFVPELMALTQTAYSTSIDGELTRRANLWEMLSLLRLALLVVLAFALLWGLSKPSRLAPIAD